MKLFWAAMFFFTFGLLVWCEHGHAGFYIEGGIGKNGISHSNNWEGRESTACMFGFGYAGKYTNNLVYDIGYSHHSQCTRGRGFDSRPEDSLDSAIFKLRYEF